MIMKKIIVVLLSVIFTLAILEVVFRNYVAVTSERPALVRNNWLKKYWWPVNNMGYRDYDHHPGDLKKKKNIIIVGDSITAGYGIKDYRDRYPNILENKLGSEWEVINISMPGWNMRQKVAAVLKYPYIKEAKLIIIQYYCDDLFPEIMTYCGVPPIASADWIIPESPLCPILEKSYFLNYVYWRIYEITYRFRKQLLKKNDDYLNCALINREKVMKDTLDGFKDIISVCEKNDIRLVILNTPHLGFNEKFADKVNASWECVQSVFSKNYIPTIDITSRYNKHKISSLRVNYSDCHPNEKAHRIIADTLFDELSKRNLVTLADYRKRKW